MKSAAPPLYLLVTAPLGSCPGALGTPSMDFGVVRMGFGGCEKSEEKREVDDGRVVMGAAVAAGF